MTFKTCIEAEEFAEFIMNNCGVNYMVIMVNSNNEFMVTENYKEAKKEGFYLYEQIFN